MARTHGLFGRGPAKHLETLDIERHRLRDAVTAPPSVAPAEADGTGGYPESKLGMLGNDVLSNCGAAMWGHALMLKSVTGLSAFGVPLFVPGFKVPHTAYIEWLYFKYGAAMGQGPHSDEGVILADWFLFLYKLGLLEAFGEETTKDSNQGRLDMAAARGMAVGVSLDAQALQEFNAHQPWGTRSITPDPQMGHAVWWGKYDPTHEWFVTWAAYQPSTIPWETNCVDERWLLLTKQDAERAGVNFASLEAECKTLANNHPVISGLNQDDFTYESFVTELEEAGHAFLHEVGHAVPFLKHLLETVTDREVVGLILKELKPLLRVV